MKGPRQGVLRLLAGVAALAAVACSPELATEPQFAPDVSFDLVSATTIQVCKVAVEPGDISDEDALGTYQFTYSIDGGSPVAFDVTAVATLLDCGTSSEVVDIAVPAGSDDIVVTELSREGTTLHTIVATTNLSGTPCLLDAENDIETDPAPGEPAGQARVDFNRDLPENDNDNCAGGGKIFFKNRADAPPPPPPPPPPGLEGCTPGYWKVEQHHDSWVPTGYVTGQALNTVFAFPAGANSQGSSTLLEGLNFGGGSGELGAQRILLRAAVAGLLNAAHPDVDYEGLSTADLIDAVDAALASRDRDTMIALAAIIDADNNGDDGCPLN